MEVTQSEIIKWRSNNASKGVDKNIWKVQTHEARGHEATKQA
jgi:hypothetical protein